MVCHMIPLTLCHVPLQYGNVLQVELDMPNRTTRDYEPSSTGWQAVLDDAFKDEEEITIQVS